MPLPEVRRRQHDAPAVFEAFRREHLTAQLKRKGDRKREASFLTAAFHSGNSSVIIFGALCRRYPKEREWLQLQTGNLPL
jgi:hypothetical protein